ncbi:MAG TPA: Lrp/AsnC family transcriptional regulator [Chloroflexota bacterium]|jgi:DNA-binding Lrp family transcriptional regulator|nr:Lrp/AsnC family transcriptional regulator [Chloroflexota bacterium]
MPRAAEESVRHGAQQAEHGDGNVPRAVDELDKRIAVALQISPRAHWRQIAAMAGTSESTARRHAERMVQAGLIRITAIADVLMPGFPSLVQFTCDRHQVGDVALRLAERDDIRFVSLVTGRFDVVAELIVRGPNELARIILQELPTIPGISHTTTETVLHNFKTSYDWGRDLLEPGADRWESSTPLSAVTARSFSFDPIDLQLSACLRQNGRMSYAELAACCGISEPMARRRVDTLINAAGVRPVAFVNPRLLGYAVELLIWLRVDLSQLEHIASALAARREVRYLSATSGFSDLVCEIILPSHAQLYLFLTRVLGMLPGIRQVDTAAELQTLKRAFVRTAAPASSAAE